MLLERKSAAAVVIGDEILTGKTQDRNTQTLAKFLVRHGVILKKTETILDDVDTIAECVRRLSATHDLVFTSGGIGPTLDDVTYAGVAKAFSKRLTVHDGTLRRMREVQPDMEINSARRRMAELPEECETFWTEGLWVPLCCVEENVFVLPGIPRLFAWMLDTVPKARLGEVGKRVRRVVFCNVGEGDVADVLLEVRERWADVGIGSYPATNAVARRVYRTMVTLEGDAEGEVVGAAEWVQGKVGGWVAEDVLGAEG